jgi:phosphate transport system permease protein
MERVGVTLSKRNERRSAFDKASSFAYLLTALVSASSLVIIAVFLFYEGLKPFFTTYLIAGKPFRVDVLSFLSATSWYGLPATSGIFFLLINTIWLSALALLVALPLSVLSALFITRIAPTPIGETLAFVTELLSAIPSVVYGLFGRGVITGFVNDLATAFSIQSKGGLSVLSGALVLAFMIMPIITTLSVNAMKAVPSVLIASSLALGASKTETNFKIVVRHASNGIFAGTVLGLGRALGEATAISMVIGNAGTGPTFDLFGITSTLTSTMLLGYSESEGVNADIRFSLGLALILLIVGMDALLAFLKKLKERYDGNA